MSPMEVFTFVIMLTDIVSLVLALAMNNVISIKLPHTISRIKFDKQEHHSPTH